MISTEMKFCLVLANLFFVSESILSLDFRDTTFKKQRVANNSEANPLMPVKIEKSLQPVDEKIKEMANDVQSESKIALPVELGKKDETCFDDGSVKKPQDLSQATIGLDFEKLKLDTFVDFIMNLGEKSYLPTQDLSNIETSLSVPQKISFDQAYELFLKVLEKEGFSLVQVGDLYKIVKRDAKYIEPLEPFLGKPSCALPNSETTVRYLTFLKNFSVSDAEPILKALLTPGAQIITLVNFNGILITDRCLSIKYAMKVINELDNAGFHEVVSMVRLKELNVVEAKEFLDLIMNKKNGNDTSALARLLSGNVETSIEYFPSNVKIVAEERTNTLILMGTESALARIEDFIVNFLDKSLVKPETPFHIYECQHMDAENLKNILKDVTKTNDSSVAKFGGIRSGMRFFNQVKIEADKFGNKLIISCTDKQDWDIIQKLLKDLDKKQPQVFIDTLIVEISSQENKGLSGQIRNRSNGNPISGLNFQTSGVTGIPYLSPQGSNFVSLLTNMINGVGSIDQGSTFLSFGPPDDIWAILKVLNTQTKVSIISRPSITIANRASGSVGTKYVKRIMSEIVVSDTGTQSSLQGLQSAPAETTISYVPQINQEGLINLKVTISMSDFLNDAGNTVDKNLETNITLANGQVVVMGGFVKTKAVESLSKAPFSGIPILGMFFKSKGRSLDKSYIFFFVTATIFKPRETPGIGLYSTMKLQQSKQLVGDCVETAFGKDPIYNYYFNGDRENYDHKIVDFANARYQPTTVDIKRDPFYGDVFNISSKGRDSSEDNFENIKSMKFDSKKILESAVQRVNTKDFDRQVIRLPLDKSLEDSSEKNKIKNFFKTSLEPDLSFEKNTEQILQAREEAVDDSSDVINNFQEKNIYEKNLYDLFKSKSQKKSNQRTISSKSLREKFLKELSQEAEDQALLQNQNNKEANSFASYLQTNKLPLQKNELSVKKEEKNIKQAKEDFLKKLGGDDVQSLQSQQKLMSKASESVTQKENLLRYLLQDAIAGDS